MKKFFTAIILAAAAFAATAQGFDYSATLLGVDGRPAAGETVAITFDIIDAAGVTLYSESQSVTADAFGTINAVVGCGTALIGSYDAIDWHSATTAAIEITRANGDVSTYTDEIAVVPAAYSAATAAALVSKTDAEGGRYRLTVDDAGTLATVYDRSRIIAIPKGYTKLLWHDEFDYEGLPDPEYWDYEEGYVRNGEVQWYARARRENTCVADGKLSLIVRNDNYVNSEGMVCPITSGSIHTKDKVKFTYGRIDIAARFDVALGTWPGLWMMPNDDYFGMWPRSGEIDIMESVGYMNKIVHFTSHCAGGANGEHTQNTYSCAVPTLDTEYHVYSLIWTEKKLEWLVDGKRKYAVTNNGSTWREYPFIKDFYIILDFAWGGGWGGRNGTDPAALPVRMDIDYVRVFQ